MHTTTHTSHSTFAPASKAKLKALVNDLSIALGDINTSNITDMSYLFEGSERKDFTGISSWDTSKVVNMSSMFVLCESFNEDIGCWDVSKATDMSGMFAGCKSFNQSLNSWDTSSLRNASGMFSGCKSFNQPLDAWDTSKVADMSLMFSFATSFNQPLGSWDISSVNDFMGMFKGASSFNGDISSWHISKSASIENMLENCAIKEKHRPKIENYYKPANQKELVNLVSMHRKDSFGKALPPLYLWEIDTSLVTSMRELFWGGERKDFSGIEDWDTSKVTDMCGMFFNCKEFNADISRWDTSNVKNMLFLFNGAHSFNADIGAWNVRNVENITMLFFNARSFDRDLSNWELDSLIYKLDAFRGCPIRKEHLPKALR